MNKIDDAIGRLGAALTRLEQASADGAAPGQEISEAGLRTGRDQLEEEVLTLRARAAEDARLRADAAGAVREALRDLRGAVTIQDSGEEAANA